MRKLFPKQIWRKIRSEVLRDERKRREEEDARLPRTDLQQRHIRNLTTLLDRDALLRLLPHNAVVAELGVDEGLFSERIIEITQPSELHLVDLWDSDTFHEGKMREVNERLKDRIEAGTVKIHRGRSVDVLESFDDASFDWLFIDTDHKYGTTRDELKLAEKKVKPGGIIAGHDYKIGNWNSGFRYGVIEAVREFCVKRDWEMIYQTCEADGHHSFALKKIEDGPG